MTHEAINRSIKLMNRSDQVENILNKYFYEFSFEQSFNTRDAQIWMASHWRKTFIMSAVYFSIIFFGKHLMENRDRFKIRTAMFVWSLMLAVFSVFGSFRVLPELIDTLMNFGFHHSVCSTSFIEKSRVAAFWTYMFSLSKLVELGDTIFLVLKKQKLLLLHYYHHMAVLSFAWYSFSFSYTPGRWYMVMNYVVHSLMYSYFTIRALGIHVHKFFAMSITCCQILQMVMGFIVSFYSFVYANECRKGQTLASFFGLIMYGSFLVMFVQFFFSKYSNKRVRSIKNVQESQKSKTD